MTWQRCGRHPLLGTHRANGRIRKSQSQMIRPKEKRFTVLAASLLQGRQRERGATCGQLSAMRLLAVPAGLPHVELLERCVENGFPFRQLTACGVVVEHKCSCRVTRCALCLSRHRPLAALVWLSSLQNHSGFSMCRCSTHSRSFSYRRSARRCAALRFVCQEHTRLGPSVMSHSSIRSKGETQSCPSPLRSRTVLPFPERGSRRIPRN
jgi:hypothetical protein